MLRFVYGRIGSGKTGYIYNEISEKIKKGAGNIILIVPEQYTFATEKALLNIIHPTLFDRINITSFTRFASNNRKKSTGRKLNEGSKTMLMNIAVDANIDKLTVFKGHNKNLSIVEDMLKLSADLKKASVTPDELKTLGMRTTGILKDKLNETSDILATYEALIADNYIDNSSDLDDLYEELKKKSLFSETEVYIDAFHSFSGQELKIIEKILEQADNLTITMTTDEIFKKADDFGPFAYSKESVSEIMDIAKKSSVKISEPICCDKKSFYRYPELRAVEENMYRANELQYENDIEAVTICEAADIRSECEAVAQEIKKLLRLENYRCRDIAIITRDLDAYGEEMEYQLSKYDIPHFRDARVSIFNQPLIQLVNSALYMCANSLTVDGVMSYLKTGLTGISVDGISEFENYILMWKISGSRFKTPFTMHPEGYGNEFSERDIEKLNRINNIREKAIKPLTNLFETLKNPTGKTAAYGIFKLLQDVNAAENLKSLAISLEYNGDEFTAHNQARIWDELIRIIDDFALVLDNTRLTKKRVYELFTAAVKNIDMGNIPKGLDEVSVGDAARIRIDAPRATFILGANDGIFPMRGSFNSLFSEKDKQQIKELGYKIGGDREIYRKAERFFSYYACCCATDKLFVGYSRQNISGEVMTASEIVSQLEKVLPNTKRISAPSVNCLDFCEGIKPAFELAAETVNENSTLSVTLKKAFENKNDYGKKLVFLQNTDKNLDFKIENQETATELFGKNLYMSASKCETYSQCPFRYFMEYGLRAKLRKPAELDPLQRGILIHHIFEEALKQYSIQEFVKLSENDLTEIINNITDEYLISRMGGEENPKRFQYLYNRYKKIALILLKRIQKEFSKSDFEPVGFEVRISNDGIVKPYEILLENGGKLKLTGTVDRVDMYENDGEKYIRVVDYKTGTKDFNLSDVLYGLNMQMLLYLFAIEKNGSDIYEDIKPCGILYYPARVSIPKAENADDSIENLKKKDNRMNGLLLNNSAVIQAMENDLSGEFIPIKISKNGDLTGQLISAETFGKLTKKLDGILYDIATGLQSGKIPAVPVNGKNYDKTCEYCDYRSVCGHTVTDEVREINSFKTDEVEKMLGGDTDDVD